MTRILVVRLDKVGDTVLSTPFLRNLRRLYPDADIVGLTSAYNHEVWQGNPDLNAMVLKPPGSFDIAIALSPTADTYRTVFATRAATRLGLVYASRWPVRLMSRRWLTRATLVDVDGRLRRGEPVPHEVRQMLSILTDAGLAVEDCPLQVYSTAEQTAEAESVLPGRALGMHLSIRWFTDGWDMAAFRQVLDALLAAFPQDTWLITHGPAEREVVKDVPCDPRVVVAGERSFGTWAALIGRCRGYVSTDTGALHVAAARQVPVVGVYEGATFSHCSQQWAPWMVRHELVRKAAINVTVIQVVDALRRLLI